MLLHSLSQPAVDTLFHQFQFDISGAFDPAAFQDAWQAIVDRHPALRTGFIWRDINKPLQVVRKSITNKFRIEDLRGKDSETQRADIDDYLRADRQTGFDLARSPLMRFCLLQLADDRWRFVWSSHHLVIDRWCLGQIYRELDRFYDPSGTSTATGARNGVPGFKEYVSWLLEQDLSLIHI